MKKSLWLFFVMVLALSALLVACGPDRSSEETADQGGGDGEPATDEAVEEPKPDQLTMWVDGDAHLEAYEVITERYTEETGITVNLVPFAQLDQVEALSLDGPAGRGPDLFFQPHDRVGDVWLQGLVAELELTEEQLQGYQEGALEALSFEGNQLGIPAIVETYALFYNTDLVPEAPQTIDELMEIGENLTNPSQDEYGFLMDATNFYFNYPFLTAAGGYVFGTDDEGAFNVDDIGLATDEVVQGAEMIQSWYENGYIPNGITDDVLKGLFQDGKVGAVVTGPWAIADFKEALGENLAVTPLPTVDGEPLNSFSGVRGWLVSEYSDHKYWATDLALFVTNNESSLTFFETTGDLVARTDVEVNDELRAGILEQAEYAVPMPNIPEMSQVWEPMGAAVEFISQGDDPREVLEEAVEQIKEQIALVGAGN